MSPRDAELLAAAWARLRAARRTLQGDVDLPEMAVGAAYYAALFAARAALSSRDLHAKTHSEAWHLFGRELVRDGTFDADLAGAAAAMQNIREDVDYDAASVTNAQARELLAVAERFVRAVDGLLNAPA